MRQYDVFQCVSCVFILSTSSCEFHKVTQKKSLVFWMQVHCWCSCSSWFCSPSHGREYNAVLKNNSRRSWPTLMAEKLEKARTKSKRSMRHIEEVDVQYRIILYVFVTRWVTVLFYNCWRGWNDSSPCTRGGARVSLLPFSPLDWSPRHHTLVFVMILDVWCDNF